MSVSEKHVLGISGGRDSAALAVYMRQHYPELDIEYFFTTAMPASCPFSSHAKHKRVHETDAIAVFELGVEPGQELIESAVDRDTCVRPRLLAFRVLFPRSRRVTVVRRPAVRCCLCLRLSDEQVGDVVLFEKGLEEIPEHRSLEGEGESCVSDLAADEARTVDFDSPGLPVYRRCASRYFALCLRFSP